jgi:hypothetical protein
MTVVRIANARGLVKDSGQKNKMEALVVAQSRRNLEINPRNPLLWSMYNNDGVSTERK